MRIPESSSLYSNEEAEQIVSKTLEENQDEIAKFLASDQGRPKTLYYTPDSAAPTGNYVARGGTVSDVRPVDGAKVSIIKDPTMPDGYRILTGYPAPRPYPPRP